MLKKFLNGVVFGAGFGIAFIFVVVIFFYFFFQPIIERKISSSSEVIGTPPSIKEEQKFLGSPAIYSGGFTDNKKGVLTGGPGKIVGKAIVNDRPISGLKLRLALNGSVLSQWGTTDEEGQYIVSVPYGEYRIDGYELDSSSADTVLAGKIEHPQHAHSSGTFEVTKDNNGRGLTFKFVDPIEKKISKKKFSISENVIINWNPYPGASHYTIQIYEKSEPHAFIGNTTLFKWSNRPSVSTTSFDLKEYGVKLKPGHFYIVEIDARDDRMRTISQTARMHMEYDFEITE